MLAKCCRPSLATGARRVVYVSCHPGSLARDAGLLGSEHGFTLAAAGVMDMFPHTNHVEAMALFERSPEGGSMTLGPLMVDVAGIELTAEDRRVLRHPLVGAAILFTRNYATPDQLASLVDEIHALRVPPLLVTVDHEGGRVQRFRSGFTELPPQRAIGHTYDLDPEAGRQLAWQCGWLLAAELRAAGIDLSFAPCVDLDYGVSEVIGDRAYHRDPEIVARLASPRYRACARPA